MRAIVMNEFGDPDVLELSDVPVPEPAAGEVLVKVATTAVLSTRDGATRTGKHPFSKQVTLPHILGAEHVGTIAGVGAGTDESLVGQRVVVSSTVPCGKCRPCLSGNDHTCQDFKLVGIHRQGSYGEFSVVPAENVHPLPEGLDPKTAAAMAAVGPVARAQVDASGVEKDDWLVIPGIAGALGSMVATVAVFRGVNVLGVERPAADTTAAQTLGVSAILDGESDDLAAAIREATGGAGANAVVDNLCFPALWENYMPALGALGRVVISGAIGGAPLPFSPHPFYLQSQSIIGLRTGSRAQTAGFWEDASNGLRLPETLIHDFPLEKVADAHRALAEGRTGGHYVLTVADLD